MKKAKFLLASLFILASVGGALAYKTNRAGSLFFRNGISQCTVPTMMQYTFDFNGTSTTIADTQSSPFGCPVITVRPYL